MGRRLGQHFLHDPAILDRIVDALDPTLDDNVVEIGAGPGTLTRRLAPRVGSLVALERDPGFAEKLERESIQGCRVIAGDALAIDWASCFKTRQPARAYKVVGNIPYAISTPLLQKALTPPVPSLIVFLLQREVADRLVAEPGTKTYGGLSIGVQVASAVQRLFAVRPGSFRPPPRVDSAVVRLEPLAEPLIPPEGHARFRRFVSGLFSQRRRQLRRALRTVTGSPVEVVDATISGLDLDPSARPEVLTPQEVVSLFEAVDR